MASSLGSYKQLGITDTGKHHKVMGGCPWEVDPAVRQRGARSNEALSAVI